MGVLIADEKSRSLLLRLQEVDDEQKQLRCAEPEGALRLSVLKQGLETASTVRLEIVNALERVQQAVVHRQDDLKATLERQRRTSKQLDQELNPRQLQNLQKDLEGISRRSTLYAQRLSEAEQAQVSCQERLHKLNTRVAELEAERSALEDKVKFEGAAHEERLKALARERESLVSQLPEELLQAYELRFKNGKRVVAQIQASSCGGCYLTLAPSELADFKSAGDRIYNCPSCDCFLVLKTQ